MYVCVGFCDCFRFIVKIHEIRFCLKLVFRLIVKIHDACVVLAFGLKIMCLIL